MQFGSPFFKSPMKDMGYDVSNYLEVDPLFGGMHDLEFLISLAHQKYKVIIDQVLSHQINMKLLNSRASRDSEKSDWYVWVIRMKMALSQ